MYEFSVLLREAPGLANRLPSFRSHKIESPKIEKGHSTTHQCKKSTMTPPKITRQRRNRRSSNQFPGKLHDLMAYVDELDLHHIITWVQYGNGIYVRDADKLLDVLQLFFGQTKYRSFIRQLNFWHFERVLEGPEKGAFVHPFFLRGNRAMCSYMSRHVDPKTMMQKLKTAAIKSDLKTPIVDQTTRQEQLLWLQPPQEYDDADDGARNFEVCTIATKTRTPCWIEDWSSSAFVGMSEPASPEIIELILNEDLLW